jgi:hypothetical protein
MSPVKRARLESCAESNEDYQEYCKFLNNSIENDAYESDLLIDNEPILIKGTEKICDGSNFSVTEFVILFMEVAQKLHLSVAAISILLQFIKIFVPCPNLIPNTYYQLVKTLNLNNIQNIQRKFVCICCSCLLGSRDEQCKKKECLDFKTKKVNVNKTPPYFITHNYFDRFRLVIQKYYFFAFIYSQ